MKGLTITSEAILLMGMIAAGVIFFLVSSTVVEYNRYKSFTFSEDRILEDLKNRIDSIRAFNGTSVVQYEMILENYELTGKGNKLILKTEESPEGKEIIVPVKLEDFDIKDKDFICMVKSESEGEVRIRVKSGKCPELQIPKDFCADNRCVDGYCTPEYGETCLSPDCKCEISDLCYPDYKEECIDEYGCVKPECIGVLNEEESCKYTWECKENLECKGAKNDPSNKACCPPDEIWNGTSCTIGCLGDPCSSDNECGSASQCGTKEDLKCNPVDPEFKNYPKACCPPGKGWNGTSCVVIKKYYIIYAPLYYDQSEFDRFKSSSLQSFRGWVQKSPFKECRDPENRVEPYFVKPEDCPELKNGCSNICGDCNTKVQQCVRKLERNGKLPKYINLGDNAIISGICKGGNCRGACGCAAGIPSLSSVTNIGMTCRGMTGPEIAFHEQGHSWGLGHVSCDVACHACIYGNPNCPDCSEPNKAQFIMDYCAPMGRYGPAGYSHLKNSVFKEYLKGCGS